MDQLCEYELKRLENIRRNEEILASLNLPKLSSLSTTSTPLKRKLDGTRKTSSKRHNTEAPVPRRQSARLRGEKPDLSLVSTVDSGAAELALSQLNNSNRSVQAKLRERIEGDIALAQAADDTEASGQRRFAKLLESIAAADLGPKREVSEDTLKEVDSLRDMLSQLRVVHAEEGTIKVTPERIYCTAFHPGNKFLIAAGDRGGTLGFWDANATLNRYGAEATSTSDAQNPSTEDKENQTPHYHQLRSNEKKRSVADDADEASEETEDQSDPVYTYRPHSSTISSMKYNADGTRLFTASYDGSIRYLDLIAQRFIQVYAYVRPATDPDAPREMLIGSIDIDPQQSQIIWFSTNDGQVGRQDLRMPTNGGTIIHTISEKKIGCLNLNPAPGRQHLLATASLDRTLSIWDIRQLDKAANALSDGTLNVGKDGPLLAEAVHGKSVTSAYWSPCGDRLVSTSYDDTLRIFSPNYDASVDLGDPIRIHHNCQTGRWVTMLRANWALPLKHDTFVIANMRRTVDLFSGVTGELLWTLTAPDILTAVPAVVAYHPHRHAIVGGTASGRMLLWS